MIRFFSAVIIAFFFVTQSFAVERGKIGISVETFSLLDLINSSSYSSSLTGSAPPLASIGLRISPSDFFDIDLSYGFSMASEVKWDSKSNTSAEPAELSHIFAIAGVINPLNGANSILGIYGRFTGIVSRMSIEEVSSTNPFFIDYLAFTPKIGIGLEPSYYFSKNFSIYFRTGVAIAFLPASKFTEPKAGGDYNQKSGYDLKNNKDGKTTIGTDGVALGLRFVFGK